MTLNFDSVSKYFVVPAQSRRLSERIFARSSAEIRTVIDRLSLTVQSGERIWIQGENGAGKTTLLRLAAGLLAPSSGRLLLDGKPIAEISRREMNAMLSHQMLYGTLSGYENLRLTAGLYGCSDRSVEEAIERWQLHGFIDSIVQSYSNGQKSLLALARATLTQPRLLLLDEPTTYLDASHRTLFFKNLAKSPSTILLTSHESGAMGEFSHRVVRL